MVPAPSPAARMCQRCGATHLIRLDMKKQLILISAAFAAIFSAACDHADTSGAEPAPAASVSIDDVRATKREVSFVLTPENAVCCAYACLPQGDVPSESDFTSVESGTAASFTVSELQPATAYTLTAWAVNADGVRCEDVTHDFVTTHLPSLTIGDLTTTETKARVEIATDGATKLFWACAPAVESAPADFQQVAAEANMTIVIDGLRAATEYMLYAYAADEDSRSETASKEFRTGDPSAFDLSAAATANCYVVTKPGTYSFKANVRGNGVSSNLDDASKHFDGTIAVGDAFAADWLWASAEGLVSGVVLDKGSATIRFTAAAAKGNAVIALFDGSEVVWSWHIWLTDDPAATLIAGSDVKYRFLDRNVGATSTAVDDAASFGFFYQWGRKDPFIAASAVVNPEGSALPAGDPFRTALEGAYVVNPAHASSWNVVKNTDASIAAGQSVDYAAAHPMTFIAYDTQVGSSGVGAWVNDDNVQYAELWGYDFQNKTNRKTMFDPCPVGYKVPAWYQEVMADADKTTLTVVGAYQSRTYNGGYWPAQGYRTRDGKLANVGRYGYYWSACAFNHGYPAQNFKGYMLYWYSRLVSNNNMQDEAIGGNVRCIQE